MKYLEIEENFGEILNCEICFESNEPIGVKMVEGASKNAYPLFCDGMWSASRFADNCHNAAIVLDKNEKPFAVCYSRIVAGQMVNSLRLLGKTGYKVILVPFLDEMKITGEDKLSFELRRMDYVDEFREKHPNCDEKDFEKFVEEKEKELFE